MLDAFNWLCLAVMDPLLGWTLHLPLDVALLIVAIGSALVLTGVRLFTTNQDLLARCNADKKRLKHLRKRARAEGDKAARTRLGLTKNAILLKELKAEGKPLLAAIIPILFLATWAFQRLEFHPPKDGQAVRVHLYLPLSAVGREVHIRPLENVTTDDAVWPREVRIDPDSKEGKKIGLASWTLTARASDEPYLLRFATYAGQVFEKELRVGQRFYSPNVRYYDHGEPSDDPATRVPAVQIEMRQYRPLGLIPGWGGALPPWLVGYLLIVIPFVFVLKPVLRIR